MPKRKRRSDQTKIESGMPKKAAACLAELTVGAAQKNPSVELERFLGKLARNVGRERIADLSRVLAPMTQRARKQLRPTDPVAKAFALTADMFDAVLAGNRTFSATVPIVLQRFDSVEPEVIGSGVLIRIVNRTFLLTAAHITDHDEEGTLCIPGEGGFMPINGSFACMRIPKPGRRIDDRLDVAYYWLDRNCVKNLDPQCYILGRPAVFLEEPRYYASYTFAGYPWRQSDVTSNSIRTNFNTITGLEVHANEYAALGLSRSRHIAVRYRRRRVISARTRKAFTGPLPHGMSGGGVYVWSEDAMSERNPRLPLAGIATEYHPERCLLIATRLNVFVRCIFHTQPDLAALASR